MTKKIKQFRYWGNANTNNYPEGFNLDNLTLGNKFPNQITQLAIQGPPGVSFYLNESASDPIMIGFSGIFNLETTGYGYINSLKFKSDQESEELAGFNDKVACLIIDIVYQEDEV